MSGPSRSIEALDLELHGMPQSTAAFLVRGSSNLLVETGPGSSLPVLLRQLAQRVERLDWIVVSHIHLDHAGAAGALSLVYPEAMIGVHPRGLRHLADPSRLWESASRIYGEQTERLWGSMGPIEPGRLVPLEDGERIDLGEGCIEVVHTPGHAKHHLSLYDEASGGVFAGDALGIQHPASSVIRPSTPPPDFDLDLALESIDRVARIDPSRIWLTHFGPGSGSAAELCEQAKDALLRWTRLVRDLDAASGEEAGLLATVRSEVQAWEAAMPEGALATVEGTNSIELNVSGIRHALTRSA